MSRPLGSEVVTGLFGAVMFLSGAAATTAFLACTPAAVSSIEGGAATAVQVTQDACHLLDPDGGLNPVVDLVCKTVDGRDVRVQMPRATYAAIRAAAPHDGGGF